MKLIVGVFLIAAMQTVFANSLPSARPAKPKANMCLSDDAKITGGDGRPWPWGNEIRFPWARIQGVWAPALVGNDCGAYFMFRVTEPNNDGERFVQITQYDPLSCKKLAWGVGYEVNQVLYASMTTGLKSFDLTIRAFDNSVLEKYVGAEKRANGISAVSGAPKSVIVLTTYPKRQWEKRSSYQMEKIQSSPSLICEGR